MVDYYFQVICGMDYNLTEEDVLAIDKFYKSYGWNWSYMAEYQDDGGELYG